MTRTGTGPALACVAALLSGAATAQPVPGTEAAHDFLCGHTVHFYSEPHGNQVEYFAPGGRTFLWYPTEDQPVPGEWALEVAPDEVTVDLCFRYPTTAWNPVTQQYEGPWHCSPFAEARAEIVDDPLEGDPFDLSDGSIPAPLPAFPQADLAELESTYGTGPATPEETAGCTALLSRLDLPGALTTRTF